MFIRADTLVDDLCNAKLRPELCLEYAKFTGAAFCVFWYMECKARGDSFVCFLVNVLSCLFGCASAASYVGV